MNKQKKITVIIVAVVAAIMLAGMIFWLVKPAMPTSNGLELVVPTPEFDTLNNGLGKIKEYNKEDVANIQLGEESAKDSVAGARRLDSIAEMLGLLQKPTVGTAKGFGEESRFGDNARGGLTSQLGEGSGYMSDLERFQNRQQQLLQSIKEISAGSSGRRGVLDLDSLVNAAGQRKGVNDSVALTTSFSNGEDNSMHQQTSSGSYWTGKDNTPKALIPLEVVENKLLKQGETITLRTLQEMTLKGQRIPAGTVLYGKGAISDKRMGINLNGFILGDKLIPGKMSILDYDGLPGIELKSNEWYQIPAGVSEDVYKAAIATYQQQQIQYGGISGNTRVPLEDVAALSAANRTAQEIFARLRVFIPYKYRLWLKVDDNNNLK